MTLSFKYISRQFSKITIYSLFWPVCDIVWTLSCRPCTRKDPPSKRVEVMESRGLLCAAETLRIMAANSGAKKPPPQFGGQREASQDTGEGGAEKLATSQGPMGTRSTEQFCRRAGHPVCHHHGCIQRILTRCFQGPPGRDQNARVAVISRL